MDEGQQKILVVDDDRSTAALLRGLLIAAGHGVETVHDGRQALEAIAKDPPDLVLLDLDLPIVNGHEVCRRLKGSPATRWIPIIIVTGHADSAIKLQSWEFGADDFLTKPFQCIEVVARCRSLLRVKNLVDQLDSAEAVVFAFARAVEAKNRYTRGHSERAKDLALQLASRIGLSDVESEILRKGALLHDVGKISLPDAILNKPDRLTDAEMDVVRQHTIQGAHIVEPLRSIRAVVPLIRWHHERIDGAGYPDRLKGDGIPLMVRVLSVVDVFDSLTSGRPYRTALGRSESLSIMRENASEGGLDASLVQEFETLVNNELIEFTPVAAAITPGPTPV